jgi:hypothetical protein
VLLVGAGHRPAGSNLYLSKFPDGTVVWTAPTGDALTAAQTSTWSDRELHFTLTNLG